VAGQVDAERPQAHLEAQGTSREHGHDPIAVGGASLDAGVLAGAGALEITVHGWDVAQACGLDHPIPASLADSLLDVAVDLVSDADRPARFAAASSSVSGDPSEALLAFLGR